jgi:hypothetical protein
MTYHQASIMARMFDELVSHSVTFRNLIVLAESPNMPAGLNKLFIFPFLLLLFFPFLLLLFNWGPLILTLVPPLLLL